MVRPLLQAENLAFAYPDSQPLFTGLNLTLNPGDCVAIQGKSGCGKSTLCKILCAVIPRNFQGDLQGTVTLSGCPLKDLSLAETVSQIAMVFQNPEAQLFAPTVEDELAFGPENLCIPRAEIRRRIDQIAQNLSLKHLLFAAPHQLSGGEKQLVALAAVLTMEPSVVIFDEAMSQLDDQATAQVKRAIQGLIAQGKAVLLVEHDDENLDIANKIYTLNQGYLQEELP